MSMSPTRKTLPCPGNTVGGAKRHPTTWPGHGSAFQKLPRQRNGRGGRWGLSWRSVWLFGGIVGLWCVGGVGIVARAQGQRKTP